MIGTGSLSEVKYSTDGSMIALIGSLSTCFFDGTSLNEIKCLDYGATNNIYSYGDVYLSDDFSFLAIARLSGNQIYFELYDVVKNRLMSKMILESTDDNDSYYSFSITLNNNDAFILLRRESGYVCFNVSREDQHVEQTEFLRDEYEGVKISPGGIMYLKKAEERELVFLDLADQIELFKINIYSENWNVVFSPDESLVAIIDGSQAQIYETVTWQLVKTLYTSGDVTSIQFSPSNHFVGIYTNSNKYNILVYEVFENSNPISLFGNPRFDGFETLIFTPDDSSLTATDSTIVSFPGGRRFMDGYPVMAYTWDLKSRETTKTFSATQGDLVAYSPDGEYLTYVEGPTQDRLELIRLSDSTLIGSYPLNIAQVFAFSPDNRFLATGGSLYRVGVWDIQTGELLQTLEDDLRDYDQSIDYRFVDVRQIGYSAKGTYLAAHFWTLVS